MCLTDHGTDAVFRWTQPSGRPPPFPRAKMSITSDEVNFLVYRYLQESGLSHLYLLLAGDGIRRVRQPVGRLRFQLYIVNLNTCDVESPCCPASVHRSCPWMFVLCLHGPFNWCPPVNAAGGCFVFQVSHTQRSPLASRATSASPTSMEH